MERRQCKYCGRYMSEDADYEFCSGTCAEKFYNRVKRGRVKRTCVECGREFEGYSDRWGNICSRCIYKKHYSAQPKPKHTAAPGNGIDDIIAEQQRILQETGKRLSYGEIMARKTRG